MLPQSYFGAGELADAFRAGRLNGQRSGYVEGAKARFRPLEEELLIAMVCGETVMPDGTLRRSLVSSSIAMAADLRKRMEEDTDG